MYRVIQFFVFLITTTVVANAKVTDEMVTNFKKIKTQLLEIDINKKSSTTDEAYKTKFAELEKAFRMLNDSYGATPQNASTVKFGAAVTLAAVDLEFFRTPLSVFEHEASDDSCFDAWFELQSSKRQTEEQHKRLYEHFRAFLKARCSAKSTPANEE